MDNLVITNNAAKKIIELSKKKEKKMLRITVTGGGCQGFQYNLDMENSSKEKDIIIKKNSAIVIVDKNSLNLIKTGSTVQPKLFRLFIVPGYNPGLYSSLDPPIREPTHSRPS